MKLLSTVIIGLSVLTINIFSQNSSQSIKWSSVGDGITGVNAEVKTIAVHGIDIYAGGFFTHAGGDSAGGIAKWDGSNWLPLGSGIARKSGYSVVSILATEDNVYAGGLFNEIGGMSINNLAVWDGTNWSDIGKGLGVGGALGDAVLSIVMLDKTIYFGGTFQSAGGDHNISSIATWNGSNWVGVGGGVSDSHNFHSVSSLAVSGNELYVGGYFTGAGEIEANGIAKWDGTKWSSFGSGIKLNQNSNDYDVRAVAVSGEDIYIGGTFLIADGDTVNHIARWNGTKWVSMGGGTNGSVYKIIAVGNSVYVGGTFSKAGDISVNHIAKWDGTNWSSLGGGVNGTVLDIEVYKYAGTIVVGGRFNNAGGISVNNIAQFTDSDNPLSVKRLSSEIPTKFSLEQNYPNPFNPETRIQFSLPSSTHVTLNIFNLLGEQVSVLVNKELGAGIYNYSWNAENLASGIYIYKLKAGNNVSQRKMVLIK